jgi:hypothetical protein
MTKQSGLGDQLYVAGYDLSGDIGSLSRIGGGPSPLPLTGINASGFERGGGPRDGGIDFAAWFNTATDQAHAVLSALPTTNVVLTYCRGTTLGNPAASMVAKQINYDGDRGTDGSLTFAVNGLSNGYGLEWGDQLTAGKRTDTGATAGSAFRDYGQATTNFGLQAYLQVFEFVGTDITIKLQESSDNGADAYADVVGGAFTQVTAGPTSERIATATNLAVEQYLKVTTVTTGGFTSCTFSVMVVRNLAIPAF